MLARRSPRAAPPPWLPNAISAVRIALIPVWGVVAELCRAATARGDADAAAGHRALAVATLLTIGGSDVLDGFLARRFGLASRLGAMLDAVADKLAQVALLLFFTVRGAPAFPSTPVWFLGLVLGRDLVLAAGWLAIHRRRGRVEVVHRAHGKLSSVLLFVLLLALTADLGRPAAAIVVALAALVAASTLDYVRFGWAQWCRGPRSGAAAPADAGPP